MPDKEADDIRCVSCFGLYQDHGEGRDCEFFRSPLNQMTTNGTSDPLSALFNIMWVEDPKRKMLKMMRGRVHVGTLEWHAGNTRPVYAAHGKLGIRGKGTIYWITNTSEWYSRSHYWFESLEICKAMMEDEYRIFMNALLGVDEDDEVVRVREERRKLLRDVAHGKAKPSALKVKKAKA